MAKNGNNTLFSLTNILVTIAIAANGVIFFQMNSIGDRVSRHLENAQIHIPRETVVSRDEFLIYQTMRDRQVSDIKNAMCRIEDMIRELLLKKK